MRTRTGIAFVVALFLAAVPAALAATSAVAPSSLGEASTGRTGTVEAPLRHREAVSQARAAQRMARQKRRAELPNVSVPPQMAAIAECESHGDPRSIGGGGLYRGKYQMTTGIWASVGGRGDPAAASEAEQDVRAAMLYKRSGAGQWPVCGR